MTMEMYYINMQLITENVQLIFCNPLTALLSIGWLLLCAIKLVFVSFHLRPDGTERGESRTE